MGTEDVELLGGWTGRVTRVPLARNPSKDGSGAGRVRDETRGGTERCGIRVEKEWTGAGRDSGRSG